MNALDAYERLHLEATPGPMFIEQNVVYALGSHGFNRASAAVYGGETAVGARTSTTEIAALVRLLAQSRNIAPYVIALARAVGELHVEFGQSGGGFHPCIAYRKDGVGKMRAALDDLLRALEEGGKDS